MTASSERALWVGAGGPGLVWGLPVFLSPRYAPRVLCGTPNFLAPEVVSRNGHSCQSDIWALGCIM